ncbi:MAG TPA: DUF4132 domain-containing protein [Dehalococcoidia bacterium]|nr:DUF4132 domain-containing protein [Dehalococcoidia bacterium]
MVAVDGSEPGAPAAGAAGVEADALIDRYLATAFNPLATTWLRLYADGLASGPAGDAIRRAGPALRAEVARRALQRWRERGGPTAFPRIAGDPRDETGVLFRMVVGVLRTLPAIPAAAITPFFDAELPRSDDYWLALIDAVERHDLAFGRDEMLIDAIRAAWRRYGPNANGLYAGPAAFREALGEAPSLVGAAVTYIATLSEAEREPWRALLAHMREATQTQPSTTWLRRARALLDAVGEPAFTARAIEWLGLYEPPREQVLSTANAQAVRGCAWVCTLIEDAELARALARAAEALHRKYSYATARSILAANACIYALGQMPGSEPAAQLIQLSRRLTDGNQRPGIERALEAVTRRLGAGREALEELAIPNAGLDANGRVRRTVGQFTAELEVAGTRPGEWRWRDGAGNEYRTPPARLKAEHAEEIKALRREREDLGKALTAQRDRIERMLLAERPIDAALWRERYLDHPLVRHIARRLIWQIQADGGETAIWQGDGLVNAAGEPVAWPDEAASVVLWHPLSTPAAVAAAWRDWLDAHGVLQPFKQAYRELYVLTDAERATGIYSNRFAAHILRQHQFKRLCDERGWRYSAVFNAPYTTRATRQLPEGGRVEFWIDAQLPAAGGYAESSGVLLYVATDQVRFCERDGRPRPLSEIPPLLFSEMMREVDLFVAVASIGNDPEWVDRGTGPRGQQYGAYWREYAFGELNGSAVTRREALARLVPRLKIADRCTLEERYLQVRGDLHTYRIHLGSGNILIEPDGRYLCIVPSARSRRGDAAGGLALPFEGDGVLSIILSKAFLLADDTHITDPTIVSQLKR